MKFVSQLLGHHLQRYPLMQIEDLYKLLQQSALGAGHALDDVDVLRQHFNSEITSMGNGPEEPVADTISPDGRLARVHLRAYSEAGHKNDALFDAFVQTAREYPPSPEKLAKFCGCVADLAGAGGIAFDQSEVARYFENIARDKYPVVRHSATFRNTYRPAYRVVCLDFLPAVEPASPS
ncbi:MAG TPA: hypothetical protein VMW70_08485 [Burkholderiales bacterium]|nr:hypothetical protein [Burkholderiales bacterium]